MLPLIKLVLMILDLYMYLIIAGAILSWLIAFGVVNIRNDFVRAVWNLFLDADRAVSPSDPQVSAEYRRHRHLTDHSPSGDHVHPMDHRG